MRKLIQLFVLSFIGLIAIAQAETNQYQQKNSLIIYTGVGLQAPLQAAADVYQQATGTEFIFKVAESGRQVLAELKKTKQGDVFIVGSPVLYANTFEENIVGEGYQLAYHTPAIVVLKGNPKNIQSLEDLARKDVRMMLGEVKADMNENTAQANAAQKILIKNGLTQVKNSSGVKSKAQMIEQIIEGKADAMLATIDSVYNNPALEIVKIAPEQNIEQVVTGGVITFSTQPEQARAFMEFISTKEIKALFARYGFEPYIPQ